MKMRAEPERSLTLLRQRRADLQKPLPAIGWKVSGSMDGLRYKYLEKRWDKCHCAFLY